MGDARRHRRTSRNNLRASPYARRAQCRTVRPSRSSMALSFFGRCGGNRSLGDPARVYNRVRKSDFQGIDIMIRSYYHAPDVSEGSVPMRGDDRQTGWMFSYVSPEERVPSDHPLRAIRRMTDAIFDRLSPRFDRLYSK